MPGFISDGYTQDGYIAAERGLYEDFNFEFRPMTRTEIAILSKDILKESNPQQQEFIAAKTVRKHIMSWDLKDERDEIVSLNTENIRRMHPMLFSRVYQILQGNDVGDVKPNDSDSQNSTTLLESDSKNS